MKEQKERPGHISRRPEYCSRRQHRLCPGAWLATVPLCSPAWTHALREAVRAGRRTCRPCRACNVVSAGGGQMRKTKGARGWPRIWSTEGMWVGWQRATRSGILGTPGPAPEASGWPGARPIAQTSPRRPQTTAPSARRQLPQPRPARGTMHSSPSGGQAKHVCMRVLGHSRCLHEDARVRGSWPHVSLPLIRPSCARAHHAHGHGHGPGLHCQPFGPSSSSQLASAAPSLAFPSQPDWNYLALREPPFDEWSRVQYSGTEGAYSSRSLAGRPIRICRMRRTRPSDGRARHHGAAAPPHRVLHSASCVLH